MELGPRSLHPVDVLERGKHQAWIAYGDQILDVIANIIYRTQTRREQDQAFGKIAGMLAILDTQMAEAPYFSGRQFRLIDAVFATMFRFFPAIDPLTPLDLFADCPRLISWRVALAEHLSVKRAVPEHFNSLLRKFIGGKHSLAATQLS